MSVFLFSRALVANVESTPQGVPGWKERSEQLLKYKHEVKKIIEHQLEYAKVGSLHIPLHCFEIVTHTHTHTHTYTCISVGKHPYLANNIIVCYEYCANHDSRMVDSKKIIAI